MTFPPFSVSVEFMREISRVRNDPSLYCDRIQQSTEKSPFARTTNFQVMPKKTIVLHKVHEEPDKECLIIKQNTLCLEEEDDICLKCCESTKNARKEVKCAEYNCNTQPSDLHISS